MAAKNFDGESAMKIQDQSANNIKNEDSKRVSEIKAPASITPSQAPGATNNHTVSSIRCASELENNMTFEKVKTMLVETESAEQVKPQVEEHQSSSQNDSVAIINQELER
jgi:hypothetical protein